MVKQVSICALIICSFFISGFSSRPKNDLRTSTRAVQPSGNISSGIDAAYTVAKSIQNPISRKKTLTSVAKAYAASGNQQRAYEIANLLAGTNTGATRLMLLTDVALSLAYQNQNQAAIDFVSQLASASERDYAYEHLALHFFSTESLRFGKACMEKVKNPIIMSRIQRKYIETLVKTDNPTEALQLARSIQSNSERDLALSAICVALARSKNYDMLSNNLESIVNLDTRNLTYKSLVEIFASQGDFKQSTLYLGWISDLAVLDQTRYMLVGYYSEKGKFESAYDLAELITNKQLRFQAFSKISVALAKTDQLDNAKELVESIESEPIQQETYALLIETLADNAKFEAALELTSKLTDQDKANALIVRAASRFGERKDYLHPTLMINQISDMQLKTQAMSAFLMSFAPYGTMDKIQELLPMISDSKVRDTTLVEIAVSLASANRTTDALVALRMIRQPSLRMKAAFSCAEAVASPERADITTPFLELGMGLLPQSLSSQERLDNLLLSAEVYKIIKQEKAGKNCLVSAEKQLSSLTDLTSKELYQKRLFKLYVDYENYEDALDLLSSVSNADSVVELYLQLPTQNLDTNKKFKKSLLNSLDRVKIFPK